MSEKPLRGYQPEFGEEVPEEIYLLQKNMLVVSEEGRIGNLEDDVKVKKIPNKKIRRLTKYQLLEQANLYRNKKRWTLPKYSHVGAYSNTAQKLKNLHPSGV